MSRRTWSTTQRLSSIPETTKSSSFHDAQSTIRSRSIQTAEAARDIAEKHCMQVLSLRRRTMSDLARNLRIDELTNKTKSALSSTVEETGEWFKGFARDGRRTGKFDRDETEKLLDDYTTAHGVLHQMVRAIFNFLKMIMMAIREGVAALARASSEIVLKVKELVLRAISKIHELFEGC